MKIFVIISNLLMYLIHTPFNIKASFLKVKGSIKKTKQKADRTHCNFLMKVALMFRPHSII